MSDARRDTTDSWLQDLIVRPGDEVWRHPRQEGLPEERAPVFFVVLHRSGAPWTHVYKVERRPGRASSLVWLLRALPGDQTEDARRWVAEVGRA